MTFTRRALCAVPDTAAAGVYLWCWVAPLAWRQKLVSLLVLALLIEFVVIQAGPFLGSVIYGRQMGMSDGQRRRTAVVLGAVYLLFAGLAAASFDAWFPFLMFAWLFGVKVFAAVLGRDPQATGRGREMTFWILSVCFYFGAVFATLFLPVPMLGITEDGEVYGLRGQYEWANFPFKAMATGFLYFSALALSRLFVRGTAMDLSQS